MADILDAAKINQPTPQPTDQNTPVSPLVHDQPPAEPAPEPPITPVSDMPVPPPAPNLSTSADAFTATPPGLDNIVVPPPEEVRLSDKTKEEVPPVNPPPTEEKPKKKRMNPAAVVTVLVLLLITIPLTALGVRNVLDIRSRARECVSQDCSVTSRTTSAGKEVISYDSARDTSKVEDDGRTQSQNEYIVAGGDPSKLPAPSTNTGTGTGGGGISTTGGANTQTTTYTGIHVCDLMTASAGCDPTKLKSITVIQNFTTGLAQYTVVYADGHAVTTTIRTTDGLVVKMETLAGGTFTTTYDATFANNYGKRCTPGGVGDGGCGDGQTCGIGAVCTGVGCINDSSCGAGVCSGRTCVPKPVPPTLFNSPPEITITRTPSSAPTTAPTGTGYTSTECGLHGGSFATGTCVLAGPSPLPTAPPTIDSKTSCLAAGGGTGEWTSEPGSECGGSGGYRLECKVNNKWYFVGCDTTNRQKSGSDNGSTTPPQCVNIIPFKVGADGQPKVLTSTDLAALHPGDAIYFGYAPGGTATKVRFRVNGGDWNESTNKAANGYFVWNYILGNSTNFSVEAQWFDGTNWN